MRQLLLAVLLCAPAARAFCGFYVSSAGAQLFNDASTVVLMRDGTRTVLSMQNNYRGPAEDFALVVPVPVVLQKDQVKTLPRTVFERLEIIASPHLVVDFDPGQCEPIPSPLTSMRMEDGGAPLPRNTGVKVEAKFEVGEYEVVILSAKDALGLDSWLKEHNYKIPPDAEPLLQPYVQNNWKFFVARVNSKKVTFENGQAVLSPLRFFYDSEKFELPVRLGLMNSAGEQDLIVHVIARSRYELANRKNAFVPSNLQLAPAVKDQFGGFYAELLARTFKATPGAAITEFAWKGALPPPQLMPVGQLYGETCASCPDDPLTRFLGADVLAGVKSDEDVAKFAAEATVTRLHLRYTRDTLTDDLVFRAAGPIAGGVPDVKVTGPAQTNRFQGRYIVRTPFDPTYCTGGGMLGGVGPELSGTGGVQARGTKLTAPFESYLRSDVPELGLTKKSQQKKKKKK